MKEMLEWSVLQKGCSCIQFQTDIQNRERKVVIKGDENLFNTSFEIQVSLEKKYTKIVKTP